MSDLLPLSQVWQDWSRLPVDERKRRAAQAILSEDQETLWRLTVAHLQFTGKKGALVSKHTLRAYRRGVLDWLGYQGGADLLRVSEDEAQGYVRRLEQGDENTKPKAPTTVQLRVIAARRLYEALAWCGFELENPFDGVRVSPDPVKPHEKREEYRLETVEALLQAAEKEGDPVTQVVLYLGVLCGLRVEEIVSLKWSGVDFQDQLLSVEGKGSKRRTVPFDPATSRALAGLPHRGDYVLMRKYGGWGPYSTDGVRKKLKTLCIKAFGINPFTQQPNAYKAVHALRHTFGVTMQELVGLLETQALMGHESLATTQRYAKVTSRKASERARAAQEGLGRRLSKE